MATSSFAFFLICATLLMVTTAVSGGGMGLGWVPTTVCNGSIAECMEGGEEFELDSEISRRMLASTKYIGYNVLQADTVLCSHVGASYYNCKTGAQANVYKRGCSPITNCRVDLV